MYVSCMRFWLLAAAPTAAVILLYVATEIQEYAHAPVNGVATGGTTAASSAITRDDAHISVA